MLDGSIELTTGDTAHRLRCGDCLAMTLQRPTSFRNPMRKTARYAVVVVAEGSTRR